MANDNSGNSGMTCVRISLILFNTISLLAGLATIGVGIWLLFEQYAVSGEEHIASVTDGSSSNKYLISNGDLKLINILILSIGVLVTFVSLIGCTGAWIKSRCLLMSYLLTVVLILMLQLLVAICAFLYHEPISTALQDELMSNLKNQYEINPENSIKHNWDVMQHHIQCCGVNGHDDWYGARAWPGKNYVPDSCCEYSASSELNLDGCGRNESPNTWFKQGCLEKIKGSILDQLHIIGSVVVTLVFLQLYGIIASILLFFHTKTPKPKSPQYKAYLYERARM